MKKSLLRDSAKRDVEGGENETTVLLNENSPDHTDDGPVASARHQLHTGLSRRSIGKKSSVISKPSKKTLEGDPIPVKRNVYSQVYKNAFRQRTDKGYMTDVASFHFINRNIRFASLFCGACCVASLVLGIFQSAWQWRSYQRILSPAPQDGIPDLYISTNQDVIAQWTKFAMFMCNILTCYGVFRYYSYSLAKLKIRGVCSDFDSYWSSGLLGYMIFEILVCLVGPIPFFRFTWYYGVTVGMVMQGVRPANVVSYQIPYASDDILIVLLFFRVYLLLRFGYEISGYNHEAVHQMGRLLSVKTEGGSVAFRLTLHHHPILTIGLMYICTMLFAAYGIQIFERPSNVEFYYFRSCLWLAFVTMTTVGYGDLYPTSDLGRFVAVIACGCALIYLAIGIHAISLWLNLTELETRAIGIVHRATTRLKVENKAAAVIQAFWRSVAIISTPGIRLESRQSERLQLNLGHSIRTFRKTRRHFVRSRIVDPDLMTLDIFNSLHELRYRLQTIEEYIYTH